jgi:hypothetical protein
MESKMKIICAAITGIITTLVIGEAVCSAVSRPIAAWRGSGISKSKLADLLTGMDKRISDLEEKMKEEVK